MLSTLLAVISISAFSPATSHTQTNEEPTPILHVAEEQCEPRPQHLRWSVRYTTPRGVGYDPGYTTLEGFFAPQDFWGERWLPFVDLRAHVFDSGKFAANAGVGLRYLGWSRIWGINTFYDYRGTKRQNYNQISVGLESLGQNLDFRLNGYLPVGWKQSPHFHTRFDHFAGHSLFLRLSREFAMKGANAEAGYYFDCCKDMTFYFAGGPYYFTGVGATTWGGQLRSSIELCDRYLRIDGNTSYDHLFKWIGQAQVSVNFTLGKKRERKSKPICTPAMEIATCAIQRVDRFEIIPLSRQHLVKRAINPATHSPWFFVFVDNLSHSNGTYESPFSTLSAAESASHPGDVIYVFPGNGTTMGMDLGIALQNNQQFLGASFPHAFATTEGTVVVPALASQPPKIANPNAACVTIAMNNVVSGFTMEIEGSGLSIGSGIYANGTVGDLSSSNNAFVGINPTSYGIYGNGATIENFSSVRDTFHSAAAGIHNIGTTIHNSWVCVGDTFNSNVNNGIYNKNTSISNLVSSGNSFTGNTTGVFNDIGTTIHSWTSLGDTFSDNNIGINNKGILTTWTLSGGTFSNNATIGIDATGEINTWTASNNVFSNNGTAGITYIQNTASPSNLSLSGNTFIGPSSPSNDFAIKIHNPGTKTLCLGFTYNNAIPSTGTPAYLFQNLSTGQLNLTPGSNSSTNTGVFDPTNNPTGTCTQL